MKKKITALILVLLTLLSSVAISVSADDIALPFSDVPEGEWYYGAIKYSYDNGLMLGTDETLFEPGKSMTRAMFVTVLARIDGGALRKSTNFSDVKDDDWFSDYVGWAETTSVVGGYEDGTFRPDTPISREEAAIIMVRYIDYIGVIAVTDKTAPRKFSDDDTIAYWSAESVNVLRRYGLIKGDDGLNFNPQSELSRAESATILMRTHQMLESIKMEEPIEQDYYVSANDCYVLGAEHMYYSGTALTTSRNAFALDRNASPLPVLKGSDTGRKYSQFGKDVPNGFADGKTEDYFALDAKMINVPTDKYRYAVIGFTGGSISETGVDATDFVSSLNIVSSSGNAVVVDIASANGYNPESNEIKLTVTSADKSFGLTCVVFFSSLENAKSFDPTANVDLIKSYKGEDTFYGEMSQSMIDSYMKEIDDKIDEIISADDVDPESIDGTCFYVSSINGSSDNDGLSPDKPVKSIKDLYYQRGPVTLFKAKPGDAVLFERGSVFYPEYNVADGSQNCLEVESGVTYSAYGDGEMPIFTLAFRFANDSTTGSWTRVDGTDVWALDEKVSAPEGSRVSYRDIGSISFDGGKYWGVKVGTNEDNPIGQPTSRCGMVTNGKDSYYEGGITFEGPQSLTNNLEYWVDNNTATLYLCCKDGNPAEVFDDIKIAQNGSAISCIKKDNVTIANLAMKWCGSFAVDTSDITDFTMRNCVCEWIGGIGLGERLGNAVQNWGSCDGFYVYNNYINQVYDTGITTQGSFGRMVNCDFSDNVIERCNMNIEVFNSFDQDDKSILANIFVQRNYERYAGYGFGHQRPIGNKTGTFYLGSKGNDENYCQNFVISDNVCLYAPYFGASDSALSRGSQSNGIILKNNLYLMSSERGYALRTRHCIARYYPPYNGVDYNKTFIPYTEQYVQFMADIGIERGSKFYYYNGYLFPEEAQGVYYDD